MSATDITVPLEHAPDEFGTGLNWAEAATEAWLAEARKAGLTAEVHSTHDENSENQAATVRVDGALFVLEAHRGRVAARAVD